MQFDVYPLRFDFVARESLSFPPGKAANILRGALGVIFRRIACVPDCRDATSCSIRESCLYAKIFEPGASGVRKGLIAATKATRQLAGREPRSRLHFAGDYSKDEAISPSGLVDWPRPFVFRARHLNGCTFDAGDPFHFDVHLFTPEHEVLEYFILTFAELARDGLGPRRAKAELQRVRSLSAEVIPGQTLRPVTLDLTPPSNAPTKIRVDFLSPTELKYEHKIAHRPEFPILFGRIRDRVSTLRRLYGPGPIEIDYQGTNARAALIRMTSCRLGWQGTERRSTRTDQVHLIGGFTGTAEYEGELREFLPWLEAARWTGVGRHSVWGKGEIELEPASTRMP
jgi:hypothetical protein